METQERGDVNAQLSGYSHEPMLYTLHVFSITMVPIRTNDLVDKNRSISSIDTCMSTSSLSRKKFPAIQGVCKSGFTKKDFNSLLYL